MSIEIRQMTIKSTLVSGRKEQESAGVASADLELLKEEVMEACRELIEQSLNELQER
jgi:hypothetical protein